MKVGIKEVAAVAGVSPATVSRVLAGRVVDGAMRAAVEAAVAKTGYRPNLAARRLRSQHNQTIGLVVADIRNPFFTAVSRAVEEIAYQHGMRVILCNTDENREKEQMYLQLMQDERVAGVIIAPSREGVDAIGADTFDFPVVLIDRAGNDRRNDAVVLDNAAGSRMLVDHLHARGLRRIAALFGTSSTGHERQHGYQAAMVALGLAPASRFVGHSEAELNAAIADLLIAEPCVEAVIGSNGIILLALARAIVASGTPVTRPVVLAGFDNDPWTELFSGGVTVIEQPVEEIGRAAMMMLLTRLENPSASTSKIVLNGKLVPRG